MKQFTDEDYKKLKEKITAIEDRRNWLQITELSDGKKRAYRIKPVMKVCDFQTEESINYAKQVWSYLILDGYSVQRMITFDDVEPPHEEDAMDLDIRNMNNLSEIIGYDIHITVSVK